MAAGYPGFSADGRHPCAQDPALAVTTRALLTNSLSQASQRAYATGQDCYLAFCEQFGLRPVPASDETLAYFVGSMHRRGLATATARQYVAAGDDCICSGAGPCLQGCRPSLTLPFVDTRSG